MNRLMMLLLAGMIVLTGCGLNDGDGVIRGKGLTEGMCDPQLDPDCDPGCQDPDGCVTDPVDPCAHFLEDMVPGEDTPDGEPFDVQAYDQCVCDNDPNCTSGNNCDAILATIQQLEETLQYCEQGQGDDCDAIRALLDDHYTAYDACTNNSGSCDDILVQIDQIHEQLEQCHNEPGNDPDEDGNGDPDDEIPFHDDCEYLFAELDALYAAHEQCIEPPNSCEGILQEISLWEQELETCHDNSMGADPDQQCEEILQILDSLYAQLDQCNNGGNQCQGIEDELQVWYQELENCFEDPNQPDDCEQIFQIIEQLESDLATCGGGNNQCDDIQSELDLWYQELDACAQNNAGEECEFIFTIIADLETQLNNCDPGTNPCDDILVQTDDLHEALAHCEAGGMDPADPNQGDCDQILQAIDDLYAQYDMCVGADPGDEDPGDEDPSEPGEPGDPGDMEDSNGN